MQHFLSMDFNLVWGVNKTQEMSRCFGAAWCISPSVSVIECAWLRFTFYFESLGLFASPSTGTLFDFFSFARNVWNQLDSFGTFFRREFFSSKKIKMILISKKIWFFLENCLYTRKRVKYVNSFWIYSNCNHQNAWNAPCHAIRPFSHSSRLSTAVKNLTFTGK